MFRRQQQCLRRRCPVQCLRRFPSAAVLRLTLQAGRCRTSAKTIRCSARGWGRLFWPTLSPCLPRPLPISHFFFVDAFPMSIIDALDDLVLQPFLDVSANGVQAWNPVDDIDGQIEAVDLVKNGKFQRSVYVSLFLVSAHMDVVVILAPVAEFVNQRSVGVEVENDGLV